MSEAKPMHRRWVGSLLSFLLPGAGIYLSGDQKSGLRWFVGMAMLWIAYWPPSRAGDIR